MVAPRHWFVLAAVGALAQASNVQAQTHSEMMVNALALGARCGSHKTDDQKFCEGYILGVADTFFYARGNDFCPPTIEDNSALKLVSIDKERLLAAAKSELRRAQLTAAAPDVLAKLFLQTFSCLKPKH